MNPARLSAAAIVIVLAALVTVCSPTEQQVADRAAQDVCRLIAPETDSGEQLLRRLIEDVEQLEALQRAALARDGGARDVGGRDR